MTEMNRDVVGARINLDTSKMIPAFKAIDQGAKGNAETFKVLNQEITVTTKNYTALASAADKMALTSEDRRKKIMSESEALVKQRTAQAELLNTKKNQLDQANQIVNAKLAAQEAIIKKRYDAIEHQELEHQKRMEILQNKATSSALKVTTTSGSNASDRTRERVLMEEQSIRQKLMQLAEREGQQSKQQAAEYEQFWIKALRTREIKVEQMREKVLQEEQKIRRAMEQTAKQSSGTSSSIFDTSGEMSSATSGWSSRLQQMAAHAVVFNAVYRGIHEVQAAMKVGLVDIESNMAGYVQTNEKYFLEHKAGSEEMVMNTRILNEETTKFLHTAHELGSEITDVTESARLWGRMYKDAAVVQEMVRKSTMLSTVDMVELEQSTKSMESTIAQYGVQIENANDAMVIGGRILDSWSKVAHDTMAPARDLGAAYERTGKIAAETGVSFDVMNGLISSGIRNTALSGENLGNMWKTVLGTIRTDKAVAEIESLGVATKEVVDGKEQWRRADDILLDLSTKVIDKNYDLTKSYADISRGVYQYAKLAASLNAGDILLGTAASIGSTGSTLEYLKVQMDTISRKAAQAKTSLLEIFNQAGDDGVRSAIKQSLDVIDQLLIGLTKIPKGAVGATASIAGLIALYKLMAPLLTQWRAAQTALSTAVAMHTTLQTAATSEMVAFTAATRAAMITTAAWTAGITLLVGAIALFVFQSGKAEKAQRAHEQALKDQDAASQQIVSQYERQIDLLPKLVNAHKNLEQSMNMGNISAEKQSQIKKQLDEVSKALVITLGEEGAKQLEAANFTDEAVQIQVNALNQLITKQNEARKNVLLDQQGSIEKQLATNTDDLSKAKDNLAKAEERLNSYRKDGIGVRFKVISAEKDARTSVEELTVSQNKLQQSLSETKVQLGQMAVNGLDALSGKAGTSSESLKQMDVALADLREQIEGNGKAITELNGLLKQLSDGQSINASNAAELILKYPELTKHIYKTADGWAFEKDAVNDLRKMKIQKAIDDLKAEQSSAFNTQMATQDRLKAYGVEAGAIKNLAQLKATLNGVKSSITASQGHDDLNNADDNKYFKSQFQSQGSEYFKSKADAEAAASAAALSEIDKIYADFEAESKSYDEKINALGKLYEDPKFGVSPDKEKKKSGNSDAEKAKKEADKAAKEAAEKRKKAYAEDLDNFKYISERQNWSIDQQAAGYEKLKKRHAQYLAEDKDAMKQWSREVVALSDKRYDEDVKGLDKKIERMRQANLQEVEMTKASLDFYSKELNKSYLTADQKAEAQKQVFDLTKKYNEQRYTNSNSWIDKESSKMEMAGKSKINIITMELQAYERMTKDKDRTAEQSFALEKNIYEKNKQLVEQQFSDFQKDLNHRKAMGEVTTQDELNAWLKTQARYRVGTEQRLQADEQVYALRKKLIDDETKLVDEMGKNYKKKMEDSKNTAVKAIEAERDAYIAAKDAEIKAIDDLLSKQQELNEDQDYESALAEKQARFALLASAVGPDGIAERKQVQKDIEKLQLDHERTLAKRSLEEQKQALQGEKDAKKDSFDKDIEATKTHYDELLQALENFSSDTANRSEIMKNIQVLKEAEKNAEILAQLDQFISDYQRKMSAITALTPTVGGALSPITQTTTSKKNLDLIEYNSNKDAWDAAKTTGNKSEMERLAARNEELRKIYGVTKDTGKLQTFHEGGVVRGARRGEETQVTAKVGEMYINDRQQDNLFKMLNFRMPSFSFTMPSTSSSNSFGGSNPHQIYNVFEMNSGDNYIKDDSVAKTYWNERDNFVRRAQSRTGVKN